MKNSTSQSATPPAAGEAAHTLPKLFVYAEGDTLAQICTGEGKDTRTVATLKGSPDAIYTEAEQIVRACNSHAALVAENAALKDMLIQFSSEDSQVHVEAFRRLKQTARSFLDAAKGGAS